MKKGETDEKDKGTEEPTVDSMNIQKNSKGEDKGKKTTTGKETEVVEEHGRKEKKKTKTPSILKFFPRTSHETRKNTTGIPVKECILVGEKLVGNIGVVGIGENNVRQQDPMAKACLAYGRGSRHSSKGEKQQQHAVRQIAGRGTEVFHAGSTGQDRTGLEGNIERTEQLSTDGGS